MRIPCLILLGLIFSSCAAPFQPRLGMTFGEFNTNCEKYWKYRASQFINQEGREKVYTCWDDTYYHFKDDILYKIVTPHAVKEDKLDVDLDVKQK